MNPGSRTQSTWDALYSATIAEVGVGVTRHFGARIVVTAEVQVIPDREDPQARALIGLTVPLGHVRRVANPRPGSSDTQKNWAQTGAVIGGLASIPFVVSALHLCRGAADCAFGTSFSAGLMIGTGAAIGAVLAK